MRNFCVIYLIVFVCLKLCSCISNTPLLLTTDPWENSHYLNQNDTDTTKSTHPFLLLNNQELKKFVINPLLSENCSRLLVNLSQIASDFFTCALKNARPINLCQGCIRSYTTANNSYTVILKKMNSLGEECEPEFLTQDRLVIVQRVFKDVESIWNAASCDNCFEKSSVNNIVNFTLSKDVIKFNKKLDALYQCVNHSSEVHHNFSMVCKDCVSNYTELNTFFSHYFESCYGSPCMDLLDAMNRTRRLWVSEFHCTKRYQSGLEVFISSGIICFLSLVFYVGTSVVYKAQNTKLLQPKRLSRVHSGYGTVSTSS